MKKIRVAVIGYGYWGPNLVRNFFNSKNCAVSLVADLRKERLEIVKRLYPTVDTTSSFQNTLKRTDIDAVIIATPVSTHYDLAKKTLESGRHVLIEKPMTASAKHAEDLIRIAAKRKKVLMVDHTFVYNGAVKKIKELIDGGVLGNVHYFDSTRINLGLFQPDVNVLTDLATHDVSILSHLIKKEPYSVQAIGVSHTNNNIENIAYMTVRYPSGMIAHFNCSWSSPVKIRQILIGGDKKMIVYNDLEPTEKVKVYDAGYKLTTEEAQRKILVDYRYGDVVVPKIEIKEALSEMAEDFLSAILHGTALVSDSNLALKVVKIIEAAQRSIKNRGKEVIL